MEQSADFAICHLQFFRYRKCKENLDENPEENLNAYIYRKINEYSEDSDDEVFWERVVEQASDYKAYRSGAKDYGKHLRELTLSNTVSDAKNIIRESYMCKVVSDVCKKVTK